MTGGVLRARGSAAPADIAKVPSPIAHQIDITKCKKGALPLSGSRYRAEV